MDEYLSIHEFAKLAGVSHQAIYKGLRNKLRPYLQEVEGKKMLSIKALRDVYGFGVAQPDAQPVAPQNGDYGIMMDALKAQLEIKDKQLAEKDKQIEGLIRTLEQQNALALTDKQAVLQLTGGKAKGEDGEETPGRKWFQFWK